MLYILLATHNGETYLREQLDSLLAQDCAGWQVIARDDGSIERTPYILSEYAAAHPDEITLLYEPSMRLGASGNFSTLLAHALTKEDASALMFCDQDDVWHSGKVRTSLEKLEELEAAAGPDVPVLVHSDMTVVDDNLNVVAPSFWRYQGINPKFTDRLNRLLVMNTVTGCATIINRALAEQSLPVPVDAVMHDWWLALVAAAFGRSAWIATPLADYRQHGKNTVGAKYSSFKKTMESYIAKVFDLDVAEKGDLVLQQNLAQVKAFLARFDDRLSGAQKKMLRAYLDVFASNRLRRAKDLIGHRLLRPGFSRNIGLFLRRKKQLW
ncbi:MAG: glycosyltransferase family 2 protein [Planctomycetota bacterium]